jgi:16S rRNA (guanine966-N2)-methyltransferase
MRVVGGLWRGRPLTAPPGRGTRPTSDKVREAMFDVLLALPEARRAATEASAAGPLAGHAALDLFAGSGGLGIEALSRGAARCTFVESSAPAVRALRANLDRLDVPVVRAGGAPAATSSAAAVVVAADARRALAADARRGNRYTLVFADPPYDLYAQVRPALVMLLGRVLGPAAVVVVESAAGTTAGLPWTVVREKRYGDTRVTFYVAEVEPTEEGEAADDDRSTR